MAGDGKLFTWTEVSKHSNSHDCWIIIDGKVYDVTKFLKYHPGGHKVILSAVGKNATDDFENARHSATAKEILYTYCVGDIDPATVPIKTNSKSSVFVIKILQFLLPLLILGLAIGIRFYTKTPSSLFLITPRLQSGYWFASMLPQTAKVGRRSSSKDEDQALGPGNMQIPIVVPNGRSSTPEERQSIKATIQQLSNVPERIKKFLIQKSGYGFASMLPQTAKVGRRSSSKDEDHALGPGNMQIAIVVPTGRSSTPEERQSIKATIQQLSNVPERVKKFLIQKSGYRFASMLPQTTKVGRGSSSKDEDQALGPGNMQISIVVPTGRSSTPKERRSIKATIQQLSNVPERVKKFVIQKSGYRFASMLPQTPKVGRGSSSKDEDQALGLGNMQISIVVPTGRSSTPKERWSIRATMQQLQNVLERIKKFLIQKSAYWFAFMLPQTAKVDRGSRSKDEDQALGPGNMQISIVVPTGRRCTPEERQSIMATIQQLQNVLEQIE